MNRSLFTQYYLLTKPGIIYGNAVTAAAGFFLASHWHNNIWLFIAMILGLSFVIASACVCNNIMDRGIDEKMNRTKNRALVKKVISPQVALVYGIILGLIGFSLLLLYTNLLTSFIAFIGFFFYVGLYTPSKRHSVYSTLIGSVSGAVPPVVGYTAVTNHFDIAALLLFLILITWQMPHFYAIALYRLEDYRNAGLPILSVKKGILTTKIHIVVYVAAFLVATSLLTVFRFTGYAYLSITVLLGLIWLALGISGFTTKDTNRWARKMFFFSLIITLVVSIMISVGGILP